VPSYRDVGIVLRTYKFSEADRIVVLITADHGQVRAVAKGVRKTTSRFGGRLERPSHLQLQLHQGRGELHTVSQVETIDHFRTVRDDYDRQAKAAALCEVIELFSHGRHDDPRPYRMLLGALKVLAERDVPTLVPAFFFRLLASEGFGAAVESCVTCGSTSDLVSFDPGGGVHCRDHRTGLGINPDTLELLRLVLGGGLNQALEVPVSGATHQLEALARATMEHHVERRLRAVAVGESG
jgi:DNA repair protein RecO (recombination protein O)